MFTVLQISRYPLKTKICLIFLTLFFAPLVQAQLNTTNEWQAGAFYGPFFTSADGIDEIIMSSGIRINKGMSHYRPEFMYMQGNTADEKYSIVGVSVRNPITVQDLDELRPFFMIGLHRSEYESNETAGKLSGNGFHLVFGADYKIVSNTYLRTDVFYGNGPAKQLLVSLALSFDFGGSAKNDSRP